MGTTNLVTCSSSSVHLLTLKAFFVNHGKTSDTASGPGDAEKVHSCGLWWSDTILCQEQKKILAFWGEEVIQAVSSD